MRVWLGALSLGVNVIVKIRVIKGVTQEFQTRNLPLDLGFSEKTTKRASKVRHAVYYSQHKEASEPFQS